MDLRSLIVKLLYRYKDISFSSIRRYIRVPAIFQENYQHQDNTTVILYTNDDFLWPTYPLRQKTEIFESNIFSIKVSLIASVKNEKENINIWVEKICAQTYRPNEIIIADGGSTDGTLELLNKQKDLCPIPIHILSNSGGNIAQGRNMAIRKSSNEIIAVTDFGCLPASDWLEKILTPFFVDQEIVVTAGIYDPVYSANKNQHMKKLWLWGNLDKISPQNYLPPGGSVAFQKKIWQEVGGYPEWLSLTGEDSYFDLVLKQLGGKWAVAPDAIVHWDAPEKFLSYLYKLFKWATGDGEMKIRGAYYWRYTLRSIVYFVGLLLIIIIPFIYSFFFNVRIDNIFFYYLLVMLICFIGMQVWSRKNNLPVRLFFHRFFGGLSQLFGYIKGSRRQKIINIRRYAKTKGVIIILSGVPIDDTGGGARCTQIAIELLRRNFVVIYLYRFPKYETVNLNLNIAHSNLIVQSIKEINHKYLIKSFQGLHPVKNIIAIVEHPIKEFLPVVEYVNKMGGKTIYDKIDAWDTSLGGKWYSKNIEKLIIAQSQIYTATAPLLVNQLAEITRRKVHLLPNAVNPEIFNPEKPLSMPMDMPHGTWTGIYIGSLWGDWFDWNLLRQIAGAYPKAAFTVIGDYRGTIQSYPKNIRFLGLKKQSELPAYIKHSNIAIIPWKVNEITQATSPIKVYEFLAMNCPVIAPRLKPLDGIPGVYQAKDSEDFIKSMDKVRKIELDKNIISAFISANTWEKRIQKFLYLCQ